MTGLIYKDLKTVGSNLKVVIILLALYLGFSIYKGSLDFYSSMEPVICVVLSMLAFGWDERSGWDKTACLFPLGRNKIVLARYLFSLLILAFVGVLHVLVSLVLKASPNEILDTFLASLSISLLFMALMFPFLYKFGSDKSRLLFLALFVGMLALTASKAEKGKYSLNFGTTLNTALALGSLGLFAFSAFISCLIYRKKDFS